MTNDHIISHDQFAKSYDQQAKDYHSYGHDALFGMTYEYIQAGELLLDLGIGTGLSSIHFAKAGLEVIGLDGSDKMLKECEKKGFTKELKQYDIFELPYPFENEQFSYIICCGVFHFFGDISQIFSEVKRLLKPKGIFAFSIAYSGNASENEFKKEQTPWGIPIYKHTDVYIHKTGKNCNFIIEKEQKLLVGSGDKSSEDILFKIFVLTRN